MDERSIIKKMASILYDGVFKYDDISYDASTGIVASIDTFVASTDMPPGMSYYHAAWKSITGGISDLICKGVLPIMILFSITIPRKINWKVLDSLARGIKEAADYYGIKIGKGDVNKGNELSITISAIGISNGRPPPREEVHPGDKIVVCDVFGYERLALDILTGKIEYQGKLKNKILKRFLTPKINIHKALWPINNGYVRASIDSSDGLVRSLYDLSIAANKKFLIHKLPVSRELINLYRKLSLDVKKYVLYGGEEYIPIFIIKNEKWNVFLQRTKALGYKYVYVGYAMEGRGVYLKINSKEVEVPDYGWDAMLGY